MAERDELIALAEDDRAEPAVLEPTHLHRRRRLGEVAVLCFFGEVLDAWAATGRLVERYRLRSEVGWSPVYDVATPAGPVAVVHGGFGAPFSAVVMEELIALGATTLVACGGAGALVDLDVGHVVVVDSALRDEGTSFHYAPAGRVLAADPAGVAALAGVAQRRGLPYSVGRTWTTDAIFRETRGRVARRVEEGCVVVDMEAAAFLAVAAYRDVRFAQLLYAGDSLVAQWDHRGWLHATERRTELLEAAIEGALALHGERPLTRPE